MGKNPGPENEMPVDASRPPPTAAARSAISPGPFRKRTVSPWHKAAVASLLSGRYCRLAERQDMLSPKIESLLPLLEELVALIHGGHAGDRAALVIEDLIGHMRCHP